MAQTTIIEEQFDDFNIDTGEIRTQHRHSIKKSKIEPTDEFVKVSKYLNTIFAYNGIPLNLVGIALILAQRMEFKTNVVYLLKSDKLEIGDMLGLARRFKKNGKEDTNTIDKMIRDCVKYDIIRPTDTRGKYQVNAFLFSTGSMADTRNLQAYFEFDSGLLITQATQKNLITGEVVRKSVVNREKTKQIPGQLSLLLTSGESDNEQSIE